MRSVHMVSHSPEQTFEFGRKLGNNLKKGTVIFLTGDLGSGKTAFVQGLARGLDVPETYYVTSPSYTLVNEYPGRFTVYHADLYRLVDGSEVADIGLEELADDMSVLIIEWAERLPEGFLNPGISIHIEVLEGDTRKFILTISDMDLNFQI